MKEIGNQKRREESNRYDHGKIFITLKIAERKTVVSVGQEKIIEILIHITSSPREMWELEVFCVPFQLCCLLLMDYLRSSVRTTFILCYYKEEQRKLLY